MDFKDIYFDTGEIRLHGLEGPASGPALVLLHGATSNCGDWMGLMPELTQRWHVFSFDLRGHGLSGWPSGPQGYHISHNLADVLALLRGVVRERAVLLGHSYGAVISALAGRDAADWLRGIALEDPPMMLRRDNDESKAFLDFFGWLYQVRKPAKTLEDVLAGLSAQNPQAPIESLRPWAQSVFWLDPDYLLAITSGDKRETVRGVDFEAHIRGIACPVLLMQADPA